MAFALVGLILLALARDFTAILVGAALAGIGAAVFHPESSRVARMASGGQHGLAQSIFQVGGNGGLAFGPLLAAFVAIVLLAGVGIWARDHGMSWKKFSAKHDVRPPNLSNARIAWSIVILLALLFSKFVYLACLRTYYTFI